MVYEQKSSVNLHCAYFKQSEWGLKNCQPIRVLKTIIIAKCSFRLAAIHCGNAMAFEFLLR